MSDEDPLESLLPEETIARIRQIVAEALSQPPKASIGAEASLTLTATVFRPSATGAIHVSGSATPRLIESAQLIDPATSKKIWESALGLTMIQIIAAILIMVYQEYREDLREISSEKIMRVIQKEIEDLLAAPKEESRPTPEPTPNKAHPSSQTFT
jgi:hypothetical protein